LSVVVGGREGKRTRVLRSLRFPCQELGREALGNALRAVGSDALAGAGGVHVVLGERRMQHFLSTAPKMSPADVVALVVREASRVTNVPVAGDVLVATRVLSHQPQSRIVLGTTALARSVWAPLAEAFAANGIEVRSLHSMEACLALATPSAADRRAAVVECNAGRARFVLCNQQCPVQVRRFLIGSGHENNTSALTTQLVMELPRTLDWLRETGQAMPDALVLGMRVTLEEGAIEMLRSEEMQDVTPAVVDIELAPGQVMPSLAVLMLVERLSAGQPLPSLLTPPRVRLPWSRARVLGVATAAAAGLLCSGIGAIEAGAWFDKCYELDEVVVDLDQLATAIGGTGKPPSAAVGEEEVRLDEALRLRRPISRLVADVSNAASPGLVLDELRFASTEKLSITGIVQGDSRQDALAAMANFARQLREITYLQSDGQEEINEVRGERNRFRFHLNLSWRNS
jgi:hypothetical protein